MSVLMDAGDDERSIELSTLSAIYPELTIDPSSPFSAFIDVLVEPIKPLAIVFRTVDGAAAAEVAVQPDIHSLSYLPTLTIEIVLPDGYPTLEPPLFRIRTTPSWIPSWRIQQLEHAALSLWEDMGRDQVVFSYIDYLREEAERGFDLVSEDADFLNLPYDLKLALIDNDLKTTQAKFEQTTHECTICMEQKSGKDCHKLSYCGHVFCTECLQDFLNSCILEGNVDSVKCMDSECSDDRTLDPSELLQISLSEEQVRRYTTLQRKRKHDSDPTTVYCPRTWCQAPARTQVAEEHQQEMRHGTGHIPREQRLAICEDCDFAFCLHCERSWHGALVWCSKRSSEMSDEELASQEYMRAYSINCPTCNSATQKVKGCNHMVCGTCRTHFCYLCGAVLEERDPYRHYNGSNAPCKGRLWEKEDGDGNARWFDDDADWLGE